MTEPTEAVRKAAEHARQVGEEVAQLVHEKQLAYGDAAGLQAKVWEAMLEPYRDGDSYRLSQPFMLYAVPRLTRVFDRVARIVAGAGEADPMGEEPWRDLAGDAVVGASIQPEKEGAWHCPFDHPGTGAPCEREDKHGHDDEHRSVHAGGVQRWRLGPAEGWGNGLCGVMHGPTGRRCTRTRSLDGGPHRHYAAPLSSGERGFGWWDDEDPYSSRAVVDRYTHGYVPEEDD